MLIKKIHVYTDRENAYIEVEGKTILDLSQCEPEKWPQQLEAFSTGLKETFSQVWGEDINVVFYGSDSGDPEAKYIVRHLAKQ